MLSMSLVDIVLDVHMKAFLRRVSERDGGSRLNHLPADRAQDAARQKCRKAGLVVFRNGDWRLTDLGRSILGRLTDA